MFSYLLLFDNIGEMLVVINDMNISNVIIVEYFVQYCEFIQRVKVIVVDCNISEEVLVWILDNVVNVFVFVDLVFVWKCVKVCDCLNQIYILKLNCFEVEILSGIVLSGCDDVVKVVVWFY